MIAEDLSYSYLRKLQKQEQESMELTEIGDNFYKKLQKYTYNMEDKLKNNDNPLVAKELENTKKAIENITKIRRNKIILRAMQSTSVQDEGMTNEEKEFYKAIINNIKHFQKVIKGEKTKENAEKKNNNDENEKEEQSATFKNIRILKDIPAYKGADGVTYGPFKKGTVVSLPPKEAEFLVNSDYGVIE